MKVRVLSNETAATVNFTLPEWDLLINFLNQSEGTEAISKLADTFDFKANPASNKKKLIRMMDEIPFKRKIVTDLASIAKSKIDKFEHGRKEEKILFELDTPAAVLNWKGETIRHELSLNAI